VGDETTTWWAMSILLTQTNEIGQNNSLKKKTFQQISCDEDFFEKKIV
jgi:hypothetical protein